MRVLLLFRGAPGCGKSTYIHENGLDSYTLSADTIRMQYTNDEAFRDRHNENGYDIISLRKAFLSSQEGTQ